MMTRCTFAVLTALLVVGCGHPELTLSPEGTTLTAGAAAATFTASGGQGEYQWELVPTTLGTLSAREGESITFTPVGMIPEATTGLLTVTSGEETASVELTVTPRSVTGRVIAISGPPATGLLVALRSADGTFTATPVDGQGQFSFPSVPPVYDLLVADYAANAFTVYRGLTRTDPVLISMEASQPVGASSATVQGTISGGAFPAPPAGHVTRVALGTPALNHNAIPQADADGLGGYELTVEFFGPATTAGTVHALQLIADGDGRATSYVGYAKSENVGLSDGATAYRDLTLAPVPATVNYSGSVVVPPGGDLVQNDVFVQVGPGALLPVARASANPSQDVVMPDLPGATVTTLVAVNTAFGTSIALRTGLPLNASGVTLTPPLAPQILTPAPAATHVTATTEFSWAGSDDTTYLVMFEADAEGDPSLAVVTTEPHVTLDALEGFGVPVPRNAAFDWTLIAFHGMSGADELAEAGFARWVYGGLSSQTATDRAVTQFRSSFTTAP